MSRDALIVGISQYQYLKKLNAPAVDAEAIAQCLEKDGDFRVTRLPEKIVTDDGLKKPEVSGTQSVSQDKLEAALEKLFLPESSQAPDTALFYFSGHGLPDSSRLNDEKGFLAVSGTDPKNPKTGISFRWLQCLLAKSPVKQQIIWLDCCHSGGVIINVGAANPGNGSSRDRCFIASSRDFESSWSDLNSPYSVMTKALLDGLEPNRLPGRWIDTFALADYVNQQLQGELQTPICTNFGEAIKLTRSDQVEAVEKPDTQTDSGICPYKGLEFFDCNDEDPKYFFGRDKLVDELLDKVRTSNFMALVGASGNGKSSVLRAGLLHQLKIGRRITGSENWQIRITRPDKNPLENLALAFVAEDLSDLDRAAELGKAKGLLEEGAEGLKRLIQVSSAPRVILVIDQFEEVFTRCEGQEEREAYLACLMGALAGTEAKLCLIIAMRADFVGKCLEHEYSGLAQRVQENMISVLPMQKAELEAAICQPANQVGLEVEQTLVTQMLNEIAGAPGSLPLLQYTLKELWQRREKNQLTFAAYQELGGITGTLDKRATEIYNGFGTKIEKDAVRHIFLKLTQLGDGTEDTRRRVLQSNLIAEPKYSAALIEKAIAKLADPENRLIVTSEVTRKGAKEERQAIVDVAHEALIRNWRLLRQWLGENRDRLRQQRKIEASAESWREQGQKKGYLLQGLPLNEAKLFQQVHQEDFPLSDIARQFIKKSLRHRQITRLKTASWLLIPAVVVGGFIEAQYRENSVKQDYAMIASNSGDYGERKAALDLIKGCKERREIDWLAPYLAERVFGNCRTLQRANLRNADLRFADLIDADLSKSIFLATDLRRAKNVAQEQFVGAERPFLCNVAFPENIIDIDPNRDCDQLSQILADRDLWMNLEDAQDYVNKARTKVFPELED
ncbi:MAG: peptidase C14 [Limnothrix sp. RL_2_0]|nr:peptidase C14 [Limnothrix sp. RL_2_0]